MSGIAVGWVLRHGPEDEPMRAVLLVIADVANCKGTDAAPGLGALMERSVRRRSAVLEALGMLVAGGWVRVEHQHRPGRATVYAIPGVSDSAWRPTEVPPRRRCGPRDRSAPADLNGALPTDPERSAPADLERSATLDLREVRPCGPDQGGKGPQGRTERSAGADSAPYTKTVLDGKSIAANAAADPTPRNGSVAATVKATESDPVKATAHRLTVLAFEQPVKPITRGGFPAVMARLEQALRGGYSPQDLARAIRAGPVTWTSNGLTAAVGMSQPRRGPTNPAFQKLRGGRPL